MPGRRRLRRRNRIVLKASVTSPEPASPKKSVERKNCKRLLYPAAKPLHASLSSETIETDAPSLHSLTTFLHHNLRHGPGSSHQVLNLNITATKLNNTNTTFPWLHQWSINREIKKKKEKLNERLKNITCFSGNELRKGNTCINFRVCTTDDWKISCIYVTYAGIRKALRHFRWRMPPRN